MRRRADATQSIKQIEMSAPLKNTNDAEFVSFLKFPVSSFSSSPTTGTRACPSPVLLPLKPLNKTLKTINTHGELFKNLLQEPVLGIELSEEVKNPDAVKLIPEVQAYH